MLLLSGARHGRHRARLGRTAAPGGVDPLGPNLFHAGTAALRVGCPGRSAYRAAEQPGPAGANRVLVRLHRQRRLPARDAIRLALQRLQELGRGLWHATNSTGSSRCTAQSARGDEYLVSFPKTQRVIQPDATAAQARAQRHHRAGFEHPNRRRICPPMQYTQAQSGRATYSATHGISLLSFS